VAAAGSFLAWVSGFAVPLIASLLAVASWLAWRGFQRWRRQRGQAMTEIELQRRCHARGLEDTWRTGRRNQAWGDAPGLVSVITSAARQGKRSANSRSFLA